MILPIVAYGDPVLRSVAKDIGSDYPGLAKLIDDMWETMYASNGVGLAAPQVNKNIRLFIIDSEQIFANQKTRTVGCILMIPAQNNYSSTPVLHRLAAGNGLIMKVVSAFRR